MVVNGKNKVHNNIHTWSLNLDEKDAKLGIPSVASTHSVLDALAAESATDADLARLDDWNSV